MLIQSREKEIAGTSGMHCVERAISTMRLVLRYSSGLPERWPYDLTKKPKHIAQLSALAFSEHSVKCWDDCNMKCGENVERMGDYISRDFDWDKYLVAFSYHPNKDGVGHMVIGSPVIHGKTTIGIVIAVEIERA